MNQFQIFLIVFTSAVVIISCNTKKVVSNRKDYQKYLQATRINLTKIDKEIVFWKKILTDAPSHFGGESKLAALYAKRFQYSGNIKEVHIADSFYNCANKLQKLFTSGIYRNLAANAITKHQFWLSKYYLDSAAKLGDNLSNTILQQFDTELELGNIHYAAKLLKRYPNPNSFDVFIRKAKLSDHNGDLDNAIIIMEQALAKVTVENDQAGWLWVKSNLGDYYSHANRFREAYQCYLDVLNVDAENYHSLKGIAWLAFSHDHNTAAAKEILSFLKIQHQVPDYDLLLAEIAAYEQNENLHKTYTDEFIKKMNNPLYGDMYNKYLFNLYANELKNTTKAMQIAQTELKNRPTPESYALLSWAYYKSGNIKEAVRIANSNVEGKCFEPDVAYQLAMIYRANGDIKKANKYFREVKISLFELGPSFEKNDISKS